jgi:hypothetical protein
MRMDFVAKLNAVAIYATASALMAERAYSPDSRPSRG